MSNSIQRSAHNKYFTGRYRVGHTFVLTFKSSQDLQIFRSLGQAEAERVL